MEKREWKHARYGDGWTQQLIDDGVPTQTAELTTELGRKNVLYEEALSHIFKTLPQESSFERKFLKEKLAEYGLQSHLFD